MLQAIKKIIIMTIVNIIFFYSFQSTADEMVLIKKYGFGLERDIKGFILSKIMMSVRKNAII